MSAKPPRALPTIIPIFADPDRDDFGGALSEVAMTVIIVVEGSVVVTTEVLVGSRVVDSCSPSTDDVVCVVVVCGSDRKEAELEREGEGSESETEGDDEETVGEGSEVVELDLEVVD